MSDEDGSAEKLDELLDKVLSLKTRGQYDQAIEILDEILEREGNAIARSNEYALRGKIKREAGRYESAIGDYDEAIELDPENHQFHYERGITNVIRGEPETGLEDFGAAIEREPEDETLRQVRAETRLTVGELETALQDAEKAVELSDTPDDRAVSLLLALAAGIALDETVSEWEEEYRNLCEDVFDAGWDFGQLESWLVGADLSTEKKSRIRELIDLLR